MNKVQKAGNSMDSAGSWLIRHVTIPIILFVVGLIFFPLGVLLWILALVLMFGK